MPSRPRSNANGVCWWNDGWESESKKTCKGVKCSAKRGIGHSDECIKEHNSHYEKDLAPEIFPGTNEALSRLKIIPNPLEEMKKENERLNEKIDELIDFAIWMTGCGYEFTQHKYFCEQRDKLLKG